MLKHPSMYALEVGRLESVFFGHWAAFSDLDPTIDGSKFFSDQFCAFLGQKYKVKEFALGWSHVLLQRSGRDETAAKELFLKYLREFIDQKRAGADFTER